MTTLVAPITSLYFYFNWSSVNLFEAVSSQRSGEIEPKAGIAIAERLEQFAPNHSIGNKFNLI